MHRFLTALGCCRATLPLLCAVLMALAGSPCHALAAPQPALMALRASHGLLVDIARAGDRLVAVGERGHVLYSDDSGRTWTQARVPVDVMLTAVWFTDARRGWAVGHDGMIVASADGGENWQLQRDGIAAQQLIDRERLDAARRAAAAAPGDADAQDALAAEEDRAGQPVYAPPLFDVWFADAENGIAVGAYGSYLYTTDGGRSWIWDAAHIDNPDGLHYYAIAAGGAGRLLIVGEAGSMYRSRDGGASWEALAAGYPGTLFGALALPPGDTVCAFGLQGTVLLSRDFGDTWRRLDSPAESVLAGGTVARGEVLIVGNVGTVLGLGADSGALADRSRDALRDNLAGVIEAPDGGLVLIGQGGAVRVPAGESDDAAAATHGTPAPAAGGP